MTFLAAAEIIDKERDSLLLMLALRDRCSIPAGALSGLVAVWAVESRSLPGPGAGDGIIAVVVERFATLIGLWPDDPGRK